MSKRLDRVVDCKDKTSSWHLNGFSDGSNPESTVFLCVGVATNGIIERNKWTLFYTVRQSDSPSTLCTYWGGAGSDNYRQQP